MKPMLVITCVLTDTIADSGSSWTGFVSENEVTVALTTSFFGEVFHEPVYGAKVLLNSDTLKMTMPGVYSPEEGFFGVSGQTYTLEVYYDMDGDGIDELFTASTTMPQKYHLDSISLKSTPFPFGSGFEGSLILHFQSSLGDNFLGAKFTNDNDLRFYSSRILRYCLFRFDIFSKESEYQRIPADWFIRHAMPYDNESRYYIYAGDTLTVELNVLTEEYHRFLEVAKTELSQNNPMFSGPRSNVPTNIEGGALGIFGAYTSSRASMQIPVNTAGLPTRP